MTKAPDDQITLSEIQYELEQAADATIAAQQSRYFKTGPGEYGEGDRFRGIRVPALRKLARQFRHTSIDVATQLLYSRWHEDRLLALLLFAQHAAKGDIPTQQRLYDLYLANTPYINNWDLVDSSAEHIVGAYLADKDKAPLAQLARSPLLWDRRIAIMATFHFIKQGEIQTTLQIARLLLDDPEDLIHKAVGWMLREVGKRDLAVEDDFLRVHYRRMPRTMLRYAIEKFPKDKRQAYLNGEI